MTSAGQGGDDVLLMMRAISETIGELIKWASSPAASKGGELDVRKIKNAAAAKVGLNRAPKLVDILAALPEAWRKKLAPLLTAKPIRSASGISVVAVMCKPHRCPHIAMTGNICVSVVTRTHAPLAHRGRDGRSASNTEASLLALCFDACSYCPGGPDSDFEYSTQAYTGYEPTSMRAIRARYDPYKQTRSRVEQLERLGHAVDKVEFIVMGGTFMSLPISYRDFFIRNLHDALSGHTSSSVEEAIAYSEQSKTKCIGLTIETRPDYFLKPHISQMLHYGCTRVEVGVQVSGTECDQSADDRSGSCDRRHAHSRCLYCVACRVAMRMWREIRTEGTRFEPYVVSQASADSAGDECGSKQ